MNKKNIDLSDIKDYDLDKTSSFTDIMSRSEKRNRKKDIEDEELTKEGKKSSNKPLKKENKNEEDSLGKTQILELTRQMKFNFEENKQENSKKKKSGISVLNIIGEINLLCIGYYIYLLTFTNYQDEESKYLITGSIIILLVLLFGLSVVNNKKISKFFNILNIIMIIAFIIFNIYTLLH